MSDVELLSSSENVHRLDSELVEVFPSELFFSAVLYSGICTDCKLEKSPNVPPVQIMPNELLALIFGHAVSNLVARDALITTPFVLSQVNRRWRDICLHLSPLWTSIVFDGRSNLTLIDKLLERSERYPLEILITDDCDHVGLLDAFMDKIASDTFRWRRLIVYMENPDFWYHLLERLEPLSVPILEELRLESHGDYSAPYPRPQIFLGDALPSLRSGSFRRELPSVQHRGITNLELSNIIFQSEFQYIELKYVLLGSPNLLHLSLTSYDFSWLLGTDTTCPAINVPSILSLTLKDIAVGYTPAVCSLLTTPSLQSFTLIQTRRTVIYFDVRDIFATPTCDVRYPKLKSLDLIGVQFGNLSLNFLHAIPTVTHLTLDYFDDNEFLKAYRYYLSETKKKMEKGQWDGEILLPMLHTMAITRYARSKLHVGHLLDDILRIRLALGKPLANVRLGSDFRTVSSQYQSGPPQ
jgi:hypothetical protein